MATTHYVAGQYTVTDIWCAPNDHTTTFIADRNIVDPTKFSASLAQYHQTATSSATSPATTISSDTFGLALKAGLSVGLLFIAGCIAGTVWLCFRVRNKRRAQREKASEPLQQQDLSASYNAQQVPYDPPPPPAWSPTAWRYSQHTSATEMKPVSYFEAEAIPPPQELAPPVPTTPELGVERKP